MAKLTIDTLWLDSKEIGVGVDVEFLDEGGINPKSETGLDNDLFEITIKLPNGEGRAWTMNKTSQRAVARQFGMDTTKWVGKKVRLMTVQQNINGQLKDVVYVKGPESPAKVV